MLVKHLMSTAPLTVAPETSLQEVAALLARHRISTLPVLAPDGTVCGVVSEADLIRDTFATDPRTRIRPVAPPIASSPVRSPGQDPRSVSEVMTRPALTVLQHSDAASAAALMTSHHVRCLPVLDAQGQLVGVLSRSDLVRVRARSDTEVGIEVAEALAAAGHGSWGATVEDGHVRLTGPSTVRERSLAAAVAASVAGVTSVGAGTG